MIKVKWNELYRYNDFIGIVVSNFMEQYKTGTIVAGRYDLEEGCFANVDEYDTRNNYNFEVHRKYIDVHLMIDGQEQILYAPRACGEEVVSYDEEKDIAFYSCEKCSYSKTDIASGEAVVLLPEEIHAPCNWKYKRHNRKIVFKIPIETVKGIKSY